MKTRHQNNQATHSAALIDNRVHHYAELKQSMVATLAALTPLTCRETFNGLVNNIKAV